MLAAMCLCCACSSGGGSASNISKAVGSASYDYRTDWAKCNLLGRVKSVEYDGFSQFFSPNGKLDDNDEPTTRFRGRVRTDTGYSGYSRFTFDDLGRLILLETDGYKATYTYEGDNFYPSSKVEEYEDEFDGSTVTNEHKYAYSEKNFDEAGNWLVRTDNGEKESRTISYYEDPYAVKKQPKYKSPKEVAEAMLKAAQKLDAEAYYATIEYKFRKRNQLTLEGQKKAFENTAKNESFQLRSFKIREIEMKDDDTAKIIVDEVHGDGSAWDYNYIVVRGEDGFWYNGAIGSGQQKKR